jgi:hypothetical protein
MRNASFVAALSALLLGACGHKDSLDPSDVSVAYGGLTTGSEEPMFGEPGTFSAAGAAEADPTIADPMVNDPATIAEQAAATRTHYLAIVWGNLQRASAAGILDLGRPKDFSGSLDVSAGAVVVVRKIVMEAGQGAGILPRSDPKVVDWQSTIYNGVDGLLLKIVGPEDATVTLTVGDATFTKQLADLDLVHGSALMPDEDYGVVWVAVAESASACAHGYLAGIRHRVKEIGGVFRGRWVSASGELRGHLRGIYGTRPDGDQVLFGKWISADGEFRGLLAGRYDEGQFHGHYLDSALALKGRVNGLYFEREVGNLGRVGFFVGTWSEACELDPILPTETEVE